MHTRGRDRVGGSARAPRRRGGCARRFTAGPTVVSARYRFETHRHLNHRRTGLTFPGTLGHPDKADDRQISEGSHILPDHHQAAALPVPHTCARAARPRPSTSPACSRSGETRPCPRTRHHGPAQPWQLAHAARHLRDPPPQHIPPHQVCLSPTMGSTARLCLTSCPRCACADRSHEVLPHHRTVRRAHCC